MVFQLTRTAIMHGETPPNIVFQRSYHPMKRIYGVRPALNHHNTPLFSSIHRSMTPQAYMVNPLSEGIGLFLAWQLLTSARTWSRSTPLHDPMHTCMQPDRRLCDVNARA